MADQTHRIVVALDLEEYAEIVLEHALDQATRHVAPDLHFLMVVEDSKTDIEEVKRRFAALVLPALEGRDRTNWRVRLTVRTGKAPEEITNLAADIRAHLIVIGRFGVHHPHRRIGLTASRVIDLATCPTFVVVPSDQTPDSQPACPECKSADLEKLLSLPSVKSDSTHARALGAAKKRDAKQAYEKTNTQREYEAHHDD